MRITILALGTRGDVQPLVALAVGLRQRRGHDVRVVAPDDFGPWIEGYGLTFSGLGLNMRELLQTGALSAFVEPGGNMILGLRRMLREMGPLMKGMMDSTWVACAGSEAIVFSAMGFGAYHVAERLQVPCYWVLPFPGFERTRSLPAFGSPALRLGGAYNLWTHRLAEFAIQQFIGRFLNRWREEQGMGRISLLKWPYDRLHGRPVPKLYSFSPAIFPRPADWGESAQITGYWYLDHPPDWQPPEDLVRFLESGAPPVYVGFGSLPHRDPLQTTKVVLGALQRAGQRGVIAAGWGGLRGEGVSQLPDSVHVLESIPHDWLFPRVAAVAHHGGSGTTGAGLRAGVPSVLIPHAGDQMLWARRVAELGVGPPPIPSRRLDTENLALAIIRAVSDPEMRARAAALGARIRAEDGVGRAIDIIEYCALGS